MRSGDYVGCYRIVGVLAQGGMGVVYEAINDQIGRRVAIKQLHPWLAPDAVQNLRFLNEARVVNLVSHPGLVTIHDYGLLPCGNAYIVMEYLEGQTLTERLRAQRGAPMTVSETVRFARQAAVALTATHDKGVVHCDLKPDNLMIIADPEVPGGERIKILDFGIASGANGRVLPTSPTRTGIAMGTPGYIAPEQIYGTGSVDGRADVYSLGVILYEMLSGKRPFSCPSDQQELVRHVTRMPPPLLEWAPLTPAPLAGLVHSMLAKQPAERPSMREVTDLLHSVEEFSSSSLIAVGQAVPRRAALRTFFGAGSAMVMLLSAFFFPAAPAGNPALAPPIVAAQPLPPEVVVPAARELPPRPEPRTEVDAPSPQPPSSPAARSAVTERPPAQPPKQLPAQLPAQPSPCRRPLTDSGGPDHDKCRDRKSGQNGPRLHAHGSRRGPRPHPSG